MKQYSLPYWFGLIVPMVVMAEPAFAQTITDIKLQNRNGKLQLQLQTDEQPQSFQTRFGETLIIDLINTQLGRDRFFQENPTPSIASVEIRQQYANTVRIKIVGTNEPPQVEAIATADGVAFKLGEESAIAENPPVTPPPNNDEEIELIVTPGDTTGYFTPEASTALGVEAPILETPVSVDIVPQEVIQDRNVTELGEALETVPGVVTNGGRGTSVFGPGFLIRGFPAEESIFRDGIQTFSLAPLSTNDIQRIEVLKGPASVLFGQGEPGGVINLISKKPLSEPFFEASATVGNFDTYRGDLDISGPLNEEKTLQYRLNVSYENYDSFRDFVDGERFLISPIVTWDINDQTSIDFYGQYQYDRETIDEGIPFTEEGIVDVPRDRFFGEEFGEFSQNQYQLGYRFNHNLNQDWSIKHALQFLEYEPERFAPLFDSFDPETGQLERLAYFAGGEYKRFFTNAELVGQFNTGSVEHEVLFGVEYRHISEEPNFQVSSLFTPINVFNPVYNNNPYAVNPEFFRDDTVETIALYLQDRIDFSPQFKAIAGLRFDSAEQFRTTQDVGQPRDEFEQTDTDFSPRFGLVYLPTENLSLYASYTSSFNPPFGTSRDPNNNTFEPETGRQFELGAKANLLENLSLTVAAFDLRKDNIVTFTENFSQVQIASVASQGIEVNLQGEIEPGWNISAAYTLLDNFITEDDDPSLVDNQEVNVPDNQLSVWTTYEIQTGNLAGLGLGLGLFFLDDRPANRENTVELPSFWRTDLALFYRRENWQAQLNIENLFDTDYFASANDTLGVMPGAPFTILGTVSIEF